MSKKLHSEQTGEAVVVAVRLPPHLLAGLDRVVARVSNPPFSMPTRSEVARGLIETALRASGDLEAKPTHTKATATTPSKPARQFHPDPDSPAHQTLERAVTVALKAMEAPGIGGELVIDLAAVVRSLEENWRREAIHAELLRLGAAGVDVLELRPDSGNGNERQEDRAIVPKGLDGTPLLTARWLKRPTPEHDSDALRVRFREALRLKKTSINKSAEPAGCSITPLRQWLNKGKELDPLYRANLAKHLDRIGA